MAYLQYKPIIGLSLKNLKKLRAETKLNAGEMSSNIKNPKFRAKAKLKDYKSSI